MDAAHAWRWGFWFRLRGYGLNVHLHDRSHLYATRGLWHRVGPVCWRPLSRN